MNKYLTLGFHLSWIAITFVLIGFGLEVISERLRANLTSGENSKISFLLGQKTIYDEIFFREQKVSSYISGLSSDIQLDNNYLVYGILGTGSGTSDIQLREILETAPIFFPDISIQEVTNLKKKNESLEREVKEIWTLENPPMDRVIELSTEITMIQREILKIFQEAFSYNEKKINESAEALSFTSSFSTRIVLLGFFITLIIFSRLQWLEYKSQRRK